MSNCSTTHVVVSHAMLKKIYELILEKEKSLLKDYTVAAIAKYAKLHTKFNAKWYRRLFKIHRLIPSTEFDLKLIATISYGYKSNAYRDDVIMGVYYRIHKSKDLVGRLLNCINASESVSISFDDLGYIESFFEKIKENE